MRRYNLDTIYVCKTVNHNDSVTLNALNIQTGLSTESEV